VKGSTFKRCTCPTVKDAKGKRVNCPKKHGSWSFHADLGVDQATGKRRQIMRGGYPTQKAAQDALNELIAQVRTDSYVPDNGMTVAEWLRTWVQQRADDGLIRPTTALGYRRHIEDYFVPAFGRVKLRDLKHSHVDKLIRDLRTPDRTAATVQRIHATLRSALSTAVKRRLILVNPAKDMEMAKVSRPRVHPWEPEELGAFLDSVQSHELGVMFEVAAMTGLRRGELLGLRWQDVDRTNRRLTVRQQITQVQRKRAGDQPVCPVCREAHAGVGFGKPKTAAGTDRTVDLDETTVGSLRAQKLTQDAERAEWVDAYRDHDLVFTRPGGDPLQPGKITELFAELVAAAGLRKIRLHDLRHGRASMLIATGAQLKEVSETIGHSSITITADTYGHLFANAKRASAEAAAALVPRKPREQSASIPAPATESAAPVEDCAAGQSVSDGGARGTRTHNLRIKSQDPSTPFGGVR
jgi:integrase